jgi:hypothetical protein
MFPSSHVKPSQVKSSLVSSRAWLIPTFCSQFSWAQSAEPGRAARADNIRAYTACAHVGGVDSSKSFHLAPHSLYGFWRRRWMLGKLRVLAGCRPLSIRDRVVPTQIMRYSDTLHSSHLHLRRLRDET